MTAYNLLQQKGQATEISAVASTPIVQQAQAAFESAVKNDTTVNQFLDDTKAVDYLMISYGLGSEITAKGEIDQALTQDPTNSNSLVNKLADSRWKTMASALDFYANGLSTLKSNSVTDTFTTTTAGNSYLEAQVPSTGAAAAQTVYANSFNLTVQSNGQLTTPEGYAIMGFPLDNQGNLEPPADSVAGYQNSDLQPINVNMFNNLSTPTTVMTPDVALSASQAVDDPNNFSTTLVVNTDQTNSDGSPTQAVVNEAFSKNGDGTWDWKITDNQGNVLSNQNVALTFNSDGSVATINGQSASSQSTTLNWSDGGTTTQSFNFNDVFQRSDFTENATVVDNTGQNEGLTLDYSKIADNVWQVQVWNDGTNTLASTVDMGFDSNGNVTSVGTYDPSTGQITQSDGAQSTTSQDITLNWASGGTSTINLNLSSVVSNGSFSSEMSPVQTDSVAIGTRQSLNIDQNGNVTATYDPTSGSGQTVTLTLGRLAVSQFEYPSNLTQYGTTSYYSANSQTGTDNIVPVGAETDANGSVLPGQGGPLIGTPKTTTGTTLEKTIEKNYNTDIFQEALGQENEALRYAVYFQQNAPSATSGYSILADKALMQVVQTAYNIPNEFYSQDIETQNATVEKDVDISKLNQPSYVNSIISLFLGQATAAGDTSGDSQQLGWQASLLSGPSDSDSGSNLFSLITQKVDITA